ncbi:FAD/NAD(P)-binding protein [Inmirania thermothiophila]|uniref:NAD(P)H-flavin reductase n=1 Tax=Inmirania thermothiophila TaxID=1750597 RepID=A0A3N1Y623_9GAMM|nr:FAD/NAD(P)-binding protein [Inmirania thermothiophila]ROR32757.1 NAD(P)H-flavin reductase [Inmirania thermothiophila]
MAETFAEGLDLPRPVRIVARRRESEDVFSIVLEPEGPFRYVPGQFNMLALPGVGEVAISIAPAPGDDGTGACGRIQHTIRIVGRVTRALAALPAGAVIGLRGPFGRGWPVAEARGRDLVLVSGGLGLAPLSPVMEYVLARRGDYGRVTLLHGIRRPGELFFRDRIDRWRAAPGTEVLLATDHADAHWQEHVGVVTTLFDVVELDPQRTVAMTCGPEPMMRFTAIHLLHKRGMAPERIFLSEERNMQCGVGRCGHCQIGPRFVCTDGPVFALPELGRYLKVEGF